MKIDKAEHTSNPFLIHEIASDLDLLDVWALPATGGRDDFPRFLEMMAALDPSEGGLPSKALVWARFRLGDLLHLDDRDDRRTIPGSDQSSLLERVPPALRGVDDAPLGDIFRMAGLVPLYRTDDEWAGEISNATVHGVVHLSWVDRGKGRYRGQLAIYVKSRGLLGSAYMALIQPFRHLIIYPALMRQIERNWTALQGRPPEVGS